jgi:epsin
MEVERFLACPNCTILELVVLASVGAPHFTVAYACHTTYKMDYIKRVADTIQSTFRKTPLQNDLEEAVNNEEWSASNTLLYTLASRTGSPEDGPVIFQHLWDAIRLGSSDWRKIYKALVLIEIILKTGSENAVHEIMKETFKIRLLTDFYHSENG